MALRYFPMEQIVMRYLEALECRFGVSNSHEGSSGERLGGMRLIAMQKVKAEPDATFPVLVDCPFERLDTRL
jgi:hypothetical protein